MACLTLRLPAAYTCAALTERKHPPENILLPFGRMTRRQSCASAGCASTSTDHLSDGGIFETQLLLATHGVIETGDGNRHMLKGVLIRALAEVLSKRPLWREAGDALFRAFDNIDFQEQIDMAEQDARVGVSSPLSALVRRLGCWLDERSIAAPGTKLAAAE
jgi:hypothetical protein